MVNNLDPFDVDSRGYHHVVGDGDGCISAESIGAFIRRSQKSPDFPFVVVSPMPIETTRYHKIDPAEVARFFVTYKRVVIDMGYKDYQIINFDEISLGGAGAAKKPATKVVTTKALVAKKVPAVRTLNMKTGLLTLILFVTAAGSALPSWVIHRGATSSRMLIDVAARGHFRLIPNGATTKVDNFVFRKHLVEHMNDYRHSIGMPALPLVLICDGDISRKNSELMKNLRDANVTLILLPANSTHLLQPIDVTLAKRIKRGHVQAARESTHGGGVMGSVSDDQVLKKRLNSISCGLTYSNILKAWTTSGLVPFTPQNLDKRNQTPLESSGQPAGRPGVKELFLKLRTIDVNRNVQFDSILRTCVDQYGEARLTKGFHGIGGMELTSDAGIQRLIEAENTRDARGAAMAEKKKKKKNT